MKKMAIIGGIDLTVLAIWFAILQVFCIPAALFLIGLRLTGLFKNRKSLLYGLIGTMQIVLMALDVFLYCMNQTMTLKTFLIFFGLNALLGISILTDKNRRIPATEGG